MQASPGDMVVKTLLASAGGARDIDLIPGSRKSPGGGNGYSFQYSCLENPMSRGAGQATVLWIAKSWTLLSTHTHPFMIE